MKLNLPEFEDNILIFEIYPVPISLFLTVYCSQILRVSAHNIVNFQSSVSHWNVSTSLGDDTYDKNKNRHWISVDYKKSRPRKYYRDMVSLWNKKVIVFDQIQLCSYPHKIHGKILFCIKILFAPKTYVKKYDKRCRPVNRVEIAKIFTYPINHFLSAFRLNHIIQVRYNIKMKITLTHESISKLYFSNDTN